MVGPRPWLVVVTGEPGSGKSTLGRDLARRLRLPFLSRDDVRWGLFASAGVWTDQAQELPDRDTAREAFLQIVEETARRGVSAVLELIVFQDRPEELERLLAVADVLVVLTTCRDAADRALRREQTDWLHNQPSVLAAFGHRSIDDHLRDGAEQVDAVRRAMVTSFDAPVLEVRTDDGYDPSLDRVADWVVAATRR